MLYKDDIIEFLRTHKGYLKERFEVNKIGLFGSYVHNAQTDSSDIDILVDMPSNYANYFELKAYLEKHFSKPVDLGLEKNFRLLVKARIEDEVIYA
jgi:predicted nucleotidyltransferase